MDPPACSSVSYGGAGAGNQIAGDILVQSGSQVATAAICWQYIWRMANPYQSGASPTDLGFYGAGYDGSWSYDLAGCDPNPTYFSFWLGPTSGVCKCQPKNWNGATASAASAWGVYSYASCP